LKEREITQRLGWKTVLLGGVLQAIPVNFLYVGLYLAKTDSPYRKRKIRIVLEFIYKSLPHTNKTKEVKKLDDHDLPSPLSTSTGRYPQMP
jgi:hypothetical protein